MKKPKTMKAKKKKMTTVKAEMPAMPMNIAKKPSDKVTTTTKSRM